eukprot:scaffold245247_cov17-Prasinocladus_malaysianus.AAC.2
MQDNVAQDVPMRTVAKLACFYTTKYTAKVDDHSGEELIANLVAASERGSSADPTADHGTDNPKLRITRIVNAMHK